MTTRETPYEFCFPIDCDIENVRTKLVALIRADNTIGNGSCSYIDECFTDDELFAHFLTWLIDSKATDAQLVRFRSHLRKCHQIQSDRESDIRNA